MDRGSETQLQVAENLNFLAQCSKGFNISPYQNNTIPNSTWAITTKTHYYLCTWTITNTTRYYYSLPDNKRFKDISTTRTKHIYHHVYLHLCLIKINEYIKKHALLGPGSKAKYSTMTSLPGEEMK